MTNLTDRSFKYTDDPIQDLLTLMKRLRDKDTGCPWDLEQTFETIVPYTLEEAYEVAEAINQNDMPELRDELGDLFLQVVFHSQIAEDLGEFNIDDVARSIVDKMVRRHPHVFGEMEFHNAEAQTNNWESLKAKERDAKSKNNQSISALDGVALALPALTRAEKLLKRAARTGFDWPNTKDIVEKLHEELEELKQAVLSKDQKHIEEEMGDVLLVVANLARKHRVDPETALRAANEKFQRRFQGMEEEAMKNDAKFAELSLHEQSELWKIIKKNETL